MLVFGNRIDMRPANVAVDGNASNLLDSAPGDTMPTADRTGSMRTNSWIVGDQETQTLRFQPAMETPLARPCSGSAEVPRIVCEDYLREQGGMVILGPVLPSR